MPIATSVLDTLQCFHAEVVIDIGHNLGALFDAMALSVCSILDICHFFYINRNLSPGNFTLKSA